MRHWYLSLCMGGVWSAGWSFNPTGFLSTVPGTYDIGLQRIGESLGNLHTLYNFFYMSLRNYFPCLRPVTSAVRCDQSRYGRDSGVISAFVSGVSLRNFSLQRLLVMSRNIFQ
jgi:hypothetical protein